MVWHVFVFVYACECEIYTYLRTHQPSGVFWGPISNKLLRIFSFNIGYLWLTWKAAAAAKRFCLSHAVGPFLKPAVHNMVYYNKIKYHEFTFLNNNGGDGDDIEIISDNHLKGGFLRLSVYLSPSVVPILLIACFSIFCRLTRSVPSTCYFSKWLRTKQISLINQFAVGRVYRSLNHRTLLNLDTNLHVYSLLFNFYSICPIVHITVHSMNVNAKSSKMFAIIIFLSCGWCCLSSSL